MGHGRSTFVNKLSNANDAPHNNDMMRRTTEERDIDRNVAVLDGTGSRLFTDVL